MTLPFHIYSKCSHQAIEGTMPILSFSIFINFLQPNSKIMVLFPSFEQRAFTSGLRLFIIRAVFIPQLKESHYAF